MSESERVVKLLQSIDKSLKDRASTSGGNSSNTSSSMSSAIASAGQDSKETRSQNTELRNQASLIASINEQISKQTELNRVNAQEKYDSFKEFKSQAGMLKDAVGEIGSSVDTLLLGMPGKMGKVFGGAFKSLASGIKTIFGGPLRAMKDLKKITLGSVDAFKKATSSVEKLTIAINGLASAVAALLSGGLSLIGGALKAVVGIFTSFVSVVKNAIKVAVSFGKTLFTLPFQLASFAAKYGGIIRKKLVEEIGGAVEKTRELFDMTSNSGEAFAMLGKHAASSVLAFENYDSELTKIFGTPEQMISRTAESIDALGHFSEIYGRSITKTVDSTLQFEKARKAFGFTKDDISYIALESRKNLEPLNKTIDRMGFAISEAGDSMSLNKKRLSKNFLELRKDIGLFGHISDDSLARVAGRAMQLGVSMQDLKGIFGKFSTFEDAANASALLSQTFGMNVDALKLIKSENPMEIVEMFRESMFMTGRSFDELNRHEKSVLASYTGMSNESLKMVMNFRDAGMDYKEIQQKLKDNEPENKKIKVLEQMNDSISKTLKVMSETSAWEAFKKGISKSIMYGTKLGAEFKRASRAMQNFYNFGLRAATGKNKDHMDKLFLPFTDTLKQIFGNEKGKGGLLDPKRFDKSFGKSVKFFGHVSELLFKKGKTVEAQRYISNELRKISLKDAAKEGGFFTQAIMIGGEFVGKFIKGFIAIGPALIESAARGFRGLVGWLTGSGNKDTKGFKQTFKDLFKLSDDDLQGLNTIWEQIKAEWNNKENWTAFDGAINYIKNAFKSMFRSVFAYFADHSRATLMDLNPLKNTFGGGENEGITDASAIRRNIKNYKGGDYIRSFSKNRDYGQGYAVGYGEQAEKAFKERYEKKIADSGLSDPSTKFKGASIYEGKKILDNLFEKGMGNRKKVSGIKDFKSSFSFLSPKFLESLFRVYSKKFPNANGKFDLEMLKSITSDISAVIHERKFDGNSTLSNFGFDFDVLDTLFASAIRADSARNALINSDQLINTYKRGKKILTQNDYASKGGLGSYFYDSSSGTVNTFNPNDQFVAGMEGGPVVNAIRYSGDAAREVMKIVRAIKSSVSGGGMQQVSSSGDRPVEVVLKVDSEVLTRVLLDNDFIGKAGNPAYTKSSQRLGAEARINPTGGPTTSIS